MSDAADNEKFYDDHVAPALFELARECKQRGMSMVASVNYNDQGDCGRTVSLVEGAPFILRLTDTLGNCWSEGGGVNVDGFILALMKWAREHGHSSACLKVLGVPTRPTAIT